VKKLKFYGLSDDLFEVESDYGFEEEIGCYQKPGVYEVIADGAGLLVVGLYGKVEDEGLWCIGIQQLNEDAAVPNWPIEMMMSHVPYSPLLVLTVPDDVQVLMR